MREVTDRLETDRLEEAYKHVCAELAALRAENARLREALEFYADADTWSGFMDHETKCLSLRGGICSCESVWRDHPTAYKAQMPRRARAALSVSKDADPDAQRPVAPLPARGAMQTPVLRLCGDHPEDGYSDCLEGTPDAARCTHLAKGGTWDDCSSRAKHSPAPCGAWLSLEQLREIEWAGDESADWCPVCHQFIGIGHAPDCWLAAKIKQAEIPMRPSNPGEVTKDARNVTGEDEIIEDGFGNAWSAKCPACGGRIEVVRPGKVQCENCG